MGYVSGEKSTPEQITFTVANENHYTKDLGFSVDLFWCVCVFVGLFGRRAGYVSQVRLKLMRLLLPLPLPSTQMTGGCRHTLYNDILFDKFPQCAACSSLLL